MPRKADSAASNAHAQAEQRRGGRASHLTMKEAATAQRAGFATMKACSAGKYCSPGTGDVCPWLHQCACC
eukprot:1233429-Rhodomonas_salina.1